MHNIEEKNGVFSFAENGKKERAWHGLGQVFDRPMFVAEALAACHADFKVSMQPLFALSPSIHEKMMRGEMIHPDELLGLCVNGYKGTMRDDTETTLGIVSDRYGVVQNEDAFKFVDMFCSGKVANRDNTPVIESCGVLGHGERIFVTAKFPESVVLDAKHDDLMKVYVVFTTTHDGSGAVQCMVTPVRVVCNNTLNFALHNNSGMMSFRHTSRVGTRLDLMVKENAEFAYNALGMTDLYVKAFKETYEHLNGIRLYEKQIADIVASVSLSDESLKVFRANDKNIFHEDIPTRGRNIYLSMRDTLENGIGQDTLTSGSGTWLMGGITSFFQNTARFKDDETKFDSIQSGNVRKKVQAALDAVLAA